MSEVVDPELITGVNALAASRALAGSASGAVNSIAELGFLGHLGSMSTTHQSVGRVLSSGGVADSEGTP